MYTADVMYNVTAFECDIILHMMMRYITSNVKNTKHTKGEKLCVSVLRECLVCILTKSIDHSDNGVTPASNLKLPPSWSYTLLNVASDGEACNLEIAFEKSCSDVMLYYSV